MTHLYLAGTPPRLRPDPPKCVKDVTAEAGVTRIKGPRKRCVQARRSAEKWRLLTISGNKTVWFVFLVLFIVSMIKVLFWLSNKTLLGHTVHCELYLLRRPL